MSTAPEVATRRSGAALLPASWSGEFREAFARLQQRLAQCSGATDLSDFTESDRTLIDRVAELAVLSGETALARPLLRGLVVRYRADGDHFFADVIVLKSAQVALRSGRPGAAFGLLCELEPHVGAVRRVPWDAGELPAWEARVDWPTEDIGDWHRVRFFAKLYLVLGQFFSADGKYARAGVMLERGAEHADGADFVSLRLSLAAVRLDQGELDECQRLLTEVAVAADSLGEPAARVQWLGVSGRCGLLRGNFSHALDCFQRVVSLCAGRGLSHAHLAALLNQAEVLLTLNQLAHAEAVLNAAAPLAAVVGSAGALARVAELRALAAERANGEPREHLWSGVRETWNSASEADAPEAQPGRPDGPVAAEPDGGPPADYFAGYEARELAVLRALARHDLGDALRQLDAAEDYFLRGDFQTDSPLVRLRLHALFATYSYYAGRAAADAGRGDEAAQHLAEAAGMFEEVRPHFQSRALLPALRQSLRGISWCAERAGDAPHAAACVARCDELLFRMADTLDPVRRAAFLENKWVSDERALVQSLDELRGEQRAADAESDVRRPLRERLWVRLRAFLHRLDDTRRRLAHDAVGRAGPAPRGAPDGPLGQWLARHPEHTAVVSFLALPDRLVVAWSGRFGMGFAVRPVGRPVLRELVRAWLVRGSECMSAWESGAPMPAGFAAAGDPLARALGLDDLVAQLPASIRQLVIVADDALHGVPIAALRVEGRYLVERFTLSRGHDRTEWDFADSPRPRSALTVAVSRKIITDAGEYDELEGVIPEARAVGEWLTARGLPPRALADATAGRAAVLEAWGEAGFVHISCHGTFEPDDPLRSGLLLAPEVGKSELLSVRDLGELDLRELRHVTLSSCWGADGFVYPGRRVVSLPETLCRRGADSVLACLWPVADAIGLPFVNRFYELLAAGLARDEALRDVQLACLGVGNRAPLAGAVPHVSHPILWAGYTLHGRPSRVRLT